MAVMTVLGKIDSDLLGVVLPHEHIMLDLRNQFSLPSEASRIALSEKKVSISNLDVLSRNPLAVQDNLILNDLAVAESELLERARRSTQTKKKLSSQLRRFRQRPGLGCTFTLNPGGTSA